MTNLPNPENYIPKQYLVCYIDLLGIREKLFAGIDGHSSAIAKDKQNEINTTSLKINTLLNLAPAINEKFHDTIEYFWSFDQDQDSQEDDKQKFINATKQLDFSVQQFSDSTLLYMELSNDIEMYIPILIRFLCVSLSSWTISCMSQGIMPRGAISIGTAWEIRKSCLFGPVISEVYNLESQVAQYPRFVVSYYLYEYLTRLFEEEKRKGTIEEYIISPLYLLQRDRDGIYILSYLENIHQHCLKNSSERTDQEKLIAEAYKYILSEYYIHAIRAKNDPQEAKLAGRYDRIIQYFLEYDEKFSYVCSELNRNITDKIELEEK